jgi:hypothetical protein
MYAHDITPTCPSLPNLSHIVTLATCPSLRTCLFSSDAAQWWPGVWGWTGPVGHGLDKGGVGTSKFVPGGTPMGVGGGHAQA